MLKRKTKRKFINLLNPVYSPNEGFVKVYEWLTSVGKYMLIVVEIVALAVFMSRFILDKENNDLTEEINSKISVLSTEPWRSNNIFYENYHKLISDVSVVSSKQELNSNVVSEIISSVPLTLHLQTFSLNGGRVSLTFSASNLNDVRIYESALKSNQLYDDVTFGISKEESEIQVNVTFNIKETV
jgi:hypothetical protein